MTKVFVGGSRRTSRLNEFIRSRIDNIIENGYTILVGDANGVDKSIQRYLFERGYTNVIVFCVENNCRNNIGNWESRQIEVASNKRKDFHYYSAKDVAMARETDYGFMIWDAKSKGTLVNIINLLRENKKTLVYLSPKRSFCTLSTYDDVEELLAKCSATYQHRFEDRIKISETGQQGELPQLFGGFRTNALHNAISVAHMRSTATKRKS
jgi:hypothetical protein